MPTASALPLIGELEPNAENLGLFLESLADGWIGELLVEIAVPCVFSSALVLLCRALARSTLLP